MSLLLADEIEGEMEEFGKRDELAAGLKDGELPEELARAMGIKIAPLAASALVTFEFERSLALLHGIPPSELQARTRMSSLLPRRHRREAWDRLGDAMDLRLPKLGTPAWLQQVLGAMLLGGMVLPFWHLWWGLGFFWGTVLLLFGLDKWLIAFPFPSLDSTIRRTVALNPILEEELRVHPAGIFPLLDDIRAAAPPDSGSIAELNH